MGYDGDIVLKAVMDHTGIDDSLKSIRKSISKGFRNIIRYGLGVRSVFALINKLRKALVDGFGDLAHVSEPFNQAMSSIINALASLKSSFAAAFAPIIQTVAPALVTFINLIGAAVDRIGMLIAALSGQKTYIKAIPVQVDYAKSLDKTSKNANNASKSLGKTNKQAKELKKTIAGFDDVEILHDNTDDDNDSGGSGGSGGGGGGVTGGGLQQALMPISKSVEDFAKKLREAWEKADFTEIGRIVGEKLKAALEAIPWDKVNNVLQKVAKSVATGLNGFLETPGLFTTIGQTIANGINAAFGAAEAYVTNFHYDSLGKAIHDLILGVVNTIEWDTIYNTVSTYATGIATTLNNVLDDPRIWNRIGFTISKALNAIVNGLYDFITTANFDVWATNLADALNKAILHHFSWVKLANTLIVLINKAFLAWKNFIETVKFDEWARIIGKNVADVITGIDWETGVYDVTETVNKLLQALTAFAEELPWKEIGQIVMNAIVQFFTEFSWLDAGKALNALASGLLDAIQGAVEAIPWEDIPEIITTAISEFLEGFDFDELLNKTLGIFKTIVEDIKEALFNNADFKDSPLHEHLQKLRDLLEKVGEIDFTQIANGFKRIVKALSPTVKGFAEGFVGFLNVIIEAGVAFFEALGPALDKIASAFEKFDPEILEQVGAALGVISAALFGISVAKTAAGVITGVASAFGTLAAKVLPLAGGAAVGEAAAAGGAAAGGTIFGKLAAGLGGLIKFGGPFAAFTATVVANTEDMGDISADVSETFGQGAEALQEYLVAMAGIDGPTAAGLVQTLGWLDTGLIDFDKSLNQVDLSLDGTGKTTDEFVTSLSAIKTQLEATGQDTSLIDTFLNHYNRHTQTATTNTDTLAKSMEGLSEASETTDTTTSGVGEAVKAFDGLSISAPLKILLIQAAIKSLGDKGKISKEESEKLFNLLDEYDSNDTVETLNDLAQGFEDAGVGPEDFYTAVETYLGQAPAAVKKQADYALKELDALVQGMETKGKESTEGLANGIGDETETEKVKDATTSLIEDDVLGTTADVGEMNSPSKKMEAHGKNLVLGLRNGMTAMAGSVKLVIKTLIKNLETYVKNQKRNFEGLGKELVTSIKTGIGFHTKDVVKAMQELAKALKEAFIDKNNADWYEVGVDITGDIYNGIDESEYTKYKFNDLIDTIGSDMADQFDKQDWAEIGTNIGMGIYNALDEMSDTLETLAWNLAVDMYNSACAALGIASPSKKFAWIGEMTMAGLGEGIEDNQKDAVEAVDSMIDTMTKHAGNLQSVANAASLTVPSVAQGKIVPDSIASKTSEDRLTSIMNALDMLGRNSVTKDELASLLQDMAKSVSTEFYIGDEQIARHANAGNERINRRYKTTWE